MAKQKFRLQGCYAVGRTLLRRNLVEHLGAEVGQCRPGDQSGGDEGEDAEHAHDGDGVTGFYGIDDIGCVFHGVAPVLLSLDERVGC